MCEYHKLVAEMYDTQHEKKDYSFEVDYVLNQVNLPVSYQRVLDVGCGTGSHLLEFSKRGFKTYGADPSDDMIRVARKKVNDAFLITGDVFDVHGKFPLVVSLFHVLNHLREGELDSFVSKVYDLVCNNGYFVFDSFNHAAFVNDKPKTIIKENSEIVPEVDYEKNTLKLLGTFDGTDYTITHKIWTNLEIKEALTNVGFSFKAYKSFTKKSMDETDYKVIYVCHKENVKK